MTCEIRPHVQTIDLQNPNRRFQGGPAISVTTENLHQACDLGSFGVDLCRVQRTRVKSVPAPYGNAEGPLRRC
jgi:hypothetical protein